MPLARISALEVFVGVAGLDACGLRGGLRLQVIAARPRLAALPVGQIGIGAALAGAHRGAVDRLLEAVRQLHFRGLAAALDDDLGRDVAPGDDRSGCAMPAVRAGSIASRPARARRVPRQIAVAGEAVLVREAEALRDSPRLLDGGGPRRLREVHQPAIMAEVLLGQLRMPVEPETAGHQPLEMPHQEIGQVEGTGLGLGELPRRRPRSRRTRSSGRPAGARRLLRPAPDRAARRCRSRRRRRRSCA